MDPSVVFFASLELIRVILSYNSISRVYLLTWLLKQKFCRKSYYMLASTENSLKNDKVDDGVCTINARAIIFAPYFLRMQLATYMYLPCKGFLAS